MVITVFCLHLLNCLHDLVKLSPKLFFCLREKILEYNFCYNFSSISFNLHLIYYNRFLLKKSMKKTIKLKITPVLHQIDNRLKEKNVRDMNQ